MAKQGDHKSSNTANLLDPPICQVAVKLIEANFRDRRNIAAEEVSAIMQQAVSRGMLRSTVTQREICKVLAREIQERAHFIWQTLESAYKQSSDLQNSKWSGAIKNEIAALLQIHCVDLFRHHEQAAGYMSGPSGMRPLEELRREALDKVTAEIDMFLLSLPKPKTLKRNRMLSLWSYLINHPFYGQIAVGSIVLAVFVISGYFIHKYFGFNIMDLSHSQR